MCESLATWHLLLLLYCSAGPVTRAMSMLFSAPKALPGTQRTTAGELLLNLSLLDKGMIRKNVLCCNIAPAQHSRQPQGCSLIELQRLQLHCKCTVATPLLLPVELPAAVSGWAVGTASRRATCCTWKLPKRM